MKRCLYITVVFLFLLVEYVSADNYWVNKPPPGTQLAVLSESTKGLILYFPLFSEGSRVQDIGQNKNNGLIVGATWESSNKGLVINFDGVNDSISLPDNGSFNVTQGAIVFHIKFNTLVPSAIYFALGQTASSTNLPFVFQARSGKFGFQNYNKSTVRSGYGETSLVAGVEYHVVFQSDGTKYQIFVNGLEEVVTVVDGPDDGRWMGTSIYNAYSDRRFDIGRIWRQTGVGGFMDAKVYSLKVFNRPLSAAEVLADYRNTYALLRRPQQLPWFVVGAPPTETRVLFIR